MQNTSDKDTSRKLDFIGALRGIGALTIIIFHMVFIPQPILWVPGILDKYIYNGGSAIILFFIISAFTLYLSLDNRKIETNKFIKFYLRRLFRIGPLFYVMLAFVIARSAFLAIHFPTEQILLNVIFAFNLFPLYVDGIVWASWIIGVEMLFYLFVPVLYYKVDNFYKSVVFIAVTMIFSYVFNLFLVYILNFNQDIVDKYLYMNFVAFLPIFGIGISSYYVYKYSILNKIIKYPLIISTFLCLCSLILFFIIVHIKFIRPFPLYFLDALAYSLFVLSLAIFSNKLFVNRITIFYGKISYSTYLIHPLLIYSLIPVYRYIYHNTTFLPIFSFFLCIVFTLLVLTPISLLAHHLIEAPGISFGKRLIARIGSTRPR